MSRRRRTVAAEDRLTPLVATYIAKREALIRHFTACLGSAAAAEDVVQDIYLKICALEPEAEVQNEAAFLYRLGSNVMLDRLRQQKRATAREQDWRHANGSVIGGHSVIDEPGAEAAIVDRQRLTLMLAALQELSEVQRQSFRLHKLEGLSQAETARALGVSLSTVEKSLRAALNHLVARLR